MQHTEPSAIIFDFDDTLVNAKPIINKALSATFADFNIDEKNLKNIDFNLSLRDYFHLIFLENIISAKDAYIRYYTEFSKDLEMLPHAETVLKLLQKHKVFTAVVSNKGSERLNKEIQHKFAWHGYFSSIIGSGDAHEDKPSAAPALLALQNSKLQDYKNVWFIGDSIIDLKTAQNLGCKAVLFGTNPIKAQEPIYLSVKNHNELLNILGKIYV